MDILEDKTMLELIEKTYRTYEVNQGGYDISIRFNETEDGIRKCSLTVTDENGNEYFYNDRYMYYTEESIIGMIVEELNKEFNLGLCYEDIIYSIINKYDVIDRWEEEGDYYA